MFPLFWDPTLILVIPGFILALWAQFKVKRTFARYDEFGSRSGWMADQVARDILRRGGPTWRRRWWRCFICLDC
jgi:Zn-dependent membrane protease YugP